jgi:hypothetical protein
MQSLSRFQLIRTVTCLALFLMACAASAQNDVCVNSIGGLGGTPTWDGQVEGDVGWNNAVRLNVSGDLGSTTATKMQMGIVGSTLYLGLVVSAPTVSPDTTVVLGFSPSDGIPSHDWRLHISPFDVAPPPDNSKSNHAFAVTYWKDSSVWNAGGGGSVAAAGVDWEVEGIRIFKLNSNHWEMEFQIPITVSAASAAGFCLTCSGGGTFKMYVNVMNTVGGTAPGVSQDVWPAGAPFPAGFITQHTPALGLWGTGSTTPRPASCTGVQLDWSNIGVQDPLNASNIVTDMRRFAAVTETTIAQCQALADNANPGSNGPQNIFRANPLNTMATGAKVSVAFRLANWGIPGASNFSALGTPIPAGCDPLSGGAQCAGVNNNPTNENPIPAMSSGTYNSTTWSLNYKQSCFYKIAAHQCIHVDMDSNDPNTRFLNKSTERNMNFVPASTYRQKAFLNGNQGPLPPGRTKHRFLLQLDLDQDGRLVKGNPDQPRGDGNGGGHTGGEVHNFNDPTLAALGRKEFGQAVTNMFQWIARGYIYTGDKIVINGHEYENVKRAGDFGYIAGHNGGISGWTTQFTGDDLTSLGNNLYTTEVKPGEERTVETVITAEEPGGGKSPGSGKFAVFADIGVAIPHGALANGSNPSVSFNAGGEYIATSHVSLEGIFGVHHFSGKSGFSSGTIYQFTGGGKFFLNPGPNRVFARAGLGGYHFSSSTTNFGGYFGGGLLHEFNAHLGVEGVYTFHTVKTPGVAAKFSTLQGGLRYVF